MSRVSNALRAARVAAGLKSKDVAETLGIRPAYYSDMESGARAFGEDRVPMLPEPMRKPVADALVAEYQERITRVKSSVG